MRKWIFAVASFFLIAVIPCRANEIYVAQGAKGSADGSGCSNAYAVSYLSSGGNWVAGNTYHLCGTITSSISVGASGASGSAITILFEANAVMTSGAYPTTGAINVGTTSYITIDGGTNGIIQNTLNGTSGNTNCLGGTCTQQVNSAGIFSAGPGEHDIEIRNLKIQDIFVRTSGSSDTTSGSSSSAIALNGAGSNISIHDNSVSHGINLIWLSPASGTQSNWSIYKNTTYESRWHICPCSGSRGNNISGLSIYGNDISGADEWDDPADAFHKDGIFVFADNGASTTNITIYDNYFHGNFGPPAHATAFLYLSTDAGSILSGAQVFNNVFDATVTGSVADALFYTGYTSSNISLYNNTFLGGSGTTGGAAIMTVANSSNFIVKNNVIQNFQAAYYLPSTTTPVTLDNNDVYNITGTGTAAAFYLNGAGYNTFASWQAAGHDTQGTSANPNLDASGHPQSSSPAIGLGANLTVLNIVALDSDKAGVARPTIGAWVAGAYASSSTSTSAPAPPTGLKATVQ